MAKLTKQEFIDKVLTFNKGKNAYGYIIHNGATLPNGDYISMASNKTKILYCIKTKNKTICTVFNYVNEEFHRFDETTAERYL